MDTGSLTAPSSDSSLKAYLYARCREIVLGHSVGRLCAEAAEHNPLFKEKARQWSILDGYYIPTRYPDGIPDGIPADIDTQEAAEDATTSMAKQVVEWVRSLI